MKFNLYGSGAGGGGGTKQIVGRSCRYKQHLPQTNAPDPQQEIGGAGKAQDSMSLQTGRG